MMSSVSGVASTWPWPARAWSAWPWVIKRPVDAAHRIDEEIARRAVKPLAAGDQQIFGFHCHANQLGRQRAAQKGLRISRAANA
jgi:hypothetical protein